MKSSKNDFGFVKDKSGITKTPVENLNVGSLATE